jgi:hypothetical protein
MKLWLILLLTAAAFGQALPAVKVNNNEGNIAITSPTYTINFPISGSGGQWFCGATAYGPYTSGYTPSLQQAFLDAEACRTANGGTPNILLKIPPALGGAYSAPAGIWINQSNTTAATGFIAVISTLDANLPIGTTVCSHGIQDNLATSTDPGLDNPDCAGDALSYQLGSTVTSLGQTTFSFDDISTGWTVYHDPAGSGTATATPQTFANATPSLDGGSMQLGLSGNSWTNVGWYKNSGINNANTNFTLDGWFYTPSLTDVQAVEFDQFQYLLAGDGGVTQNTRLYFGTQCVIGGFWDVWDSFSAGWVSTGQSCTWGAGTWQHLVIKVHRVAGDTSGAGGYPKMHFDLITLNGNFITSNQITSAGPLPSGWGENAGFMLQMDTNFACGSACTITENVDEAKFSAFQGPITLANGFVTNSSAYNDVASMYTLEGSGTTPTALRFCSPVGGGSTSSAVPACTASVIGPDHWLFEDMEARPQVGDINNQDIISMIGSGSETSTSQYSSHIHFRKVWAHGDWTTIAAGLNSVSSAYDLNACIYCSLLDSQMSQALRPGNEGHGIAADGLELKINHNWIEGQSIGIISGGYCTLPSISGYVPFQDIQEGRDKFTFPYAWLGLGTITGNAHWNGSSIVRKNANEIKEGERILRYGNIMENVDNSGGQSGVMGDIKTDNNSCGLGTNYQSTTNDITDVSNIWRNGCMAFETVRSPGFNSSGVTFGVKNLSESNSLWYNISGTNYGCSSAVGVTLSAQAYAWQGTMTENPAGTQATFTANCSVDAGGCIGQVSSGSVVSAGTGCVNNGAITIGAPNVIGGNQAVATTTCSGGGISAVKITNFGTGYTSAPLGTPANGTGTVQFFINTSSAAPGTGYQVFDISAGDPVGITQCNSVTSFNQPTTLYSTTYQPSAVGPAAISGTNPNSLTVTVPWNSTPANSSDTNGYCKLTNIQGWPQNLLWTHNTVISNASFLLTASNGKNNSVSDGPNFQINALLRDSIFVGSGGWNNSPFGEGTATQKFDFDITTLSADHLVWNGRTASNYTEYGNNASFPDSAGCTGAGCHPPTTMYFPSTSYCTGASPTSGCIGFIGAMSASSMPLVLPDYHNFALITGSSFQAGGADQASDSTDMGAHLSALDAAQTLNLYGAGFFPDVPAGTASTPTFTPGTGTYASTQAVTISTASAGAIICWNTSGAPATNGTNGCTTGTLYTAPVSVSVSETLYAVAGGSGYIDSSVNSAVYVITPPGGNGIWNIQGSATFNGTWIIK